MKDEVILLLDFSFFSIFDSPKIFLISYMYIFFHLFNSFDPLYCAKILLDPYHIYFSYHHLVAPSEIKVV